MPNIRTRDRLIDDMQRRYKGEFYTPTVWVDEAHKVISKSLGADWKREYVVWDNSCGTGNLTRDYSFEKLYQSTLYKEDIDVMNTNKINNGSIKFQYDFLANGTELTGLPVGLQDAIRNNKKIVFFANPPFVSATAMGNSSRAGAMAGATATSMNKDGLAKAKNLYIQFMYKVCKYIEKYNLTNVKMYYFTPVNFATGPSFKRFRKYFSKYFTIKNSFMFQASEFSNVAANWGIVFNEYNQSSCDDLGFRSNILKLVDNIIVKIGTTDIYNLDNKTKAGDWIREEVKKLKTYDRPQLSSGCTIRPDGRGRMVDNSLGYFNNNGNSVNHNNSSAGLYSSAFSNANGLSVIPKNFLKIVALFTARRTITGKYSNWVNATQEYTAPNVNYDGRGRMVNNGLGYFNNGGNNVNHNNSSVGLYSSAFSNAHGLSVIPKNFLETVALFTARRTITGKYSNWVNETQEYIAPNVNHDDYKQWNYDAIIYSLFNNNSNQSSLRDVEYKGKIWQIKNNFFWMRKSFMQDLINEHSFTDMYQDMRGAEESFLIKNYSDVNLYSKDAIELLSASSDIIKETFKYRKTMHSEHPDYNLQAWDAGWYQIKKVAREYTPDKLREFTVKYKRFEDRMREGVYKFGFLYQ